MILHMDMGVTIYSKAVGNDYLDGGDGDDIAIYSETTQIMMSFKLHQEN